MEAKQRIEPLVDTLADIALPFGLAFAALMAVIVVWLNVSNWKRRKRLTAAERKSEDLSADAENQIW